MNLETTPDNASRAELLAMQHEPVMDESDIIRQLGIYKAEASRLAKELEQAKAAALTEDERRIIRSAISGMHMKPGGVLEGLWRKAVKGGGGQ